MHSKYDIYVFSITTFEGLVLSSDIEYLYWVAFRISLNGIALVMTVVNSVFTW